MKKFAEHGLHRGWSSVVALALSLACAASFAHAQAVPTATQSLGLSVFGAASEVAPDYGPGHDLGYVFGGDITRHFRIGDISIDPRYGWTSGNTITQSYFLGNVKLGRTIGRGDRFHPYAFGGVGYGKINFGYPSYARDSSVIEAIGGGLDYDVARNFAIKGEFQYQFWDFGYLSNGLSPHGFNLGFVYRVHSIPFVHRH